MLHTGSSASDKEKSVRGAFHGDQSTSDQFCRHCSAWRGCLGLEPTPDLYVAHIVEVMREVRRTLRDDGTLWLNLGDSYASGKGTCYNPGGGDNSLGKTRKEAGAHPLDRGNKSTLTAMGLKPKDLVGIPWRVAFALQADGWWWRQWIPWVKTNAMPGPWQDRPGTSVEVVHLFSKSANYFFDMEAAKQTLAIQRNWRNGDALLIMDLPTKGFKGAHFATFPEDLPALCITAGTSKQGCCPECGTPWVRVVEKETVTAHNGKTDSAYKKGTTANRLALLRQAARERGEEYQNKVTTIGWDPGCECGELVDSGGVSPQGFSIDVFKHHDPIPCRVLDPFFGAGTVGLVADRLGRDATGIDLNAEYCAMSRDRIIGDAPMFVQVEIR